MGFLVARNQVCEISGGQKWCPQWEFPGARDDGVHEVPGGLGGQPKFRQPGTGPAGFLVAGNQVRVGSGGPSPNPPHQNICQKGGVGGLFGRGVESRRAIFRRVEFRRVDVYILELPVVEMIWWARSLCEFGILFVCVSCVCCTHLTPPG